MIVIGCTAAILLQHRPVISGASTGLRAQLGEVLGGLRGQLKEDIAGPDTRLAGLRAALYRMMGLQLLGIVGLTVTLMKLLD